MASPILTPGYGNPAPPIPNPPAVQLNMARTVHLDPINGNDATAQRGTDLAFSTFANALAALQAGDTLEMRPSVYSYAGELVLSVADVTINANGATLRAAADEEESCKLRITANGARINGMTFDGRRVAGAAGSIFFALLEVFSSDVQVRGCVFQNSVGIGILSRGAIERLVIDECDFKNLFCGITPYGDPRDIRITNNRFRSGWSFGAFSGAIKVVSHAHATTGVWLTAKGGLIANNILDSAGEMGIELWAGPERFIVTGNKITGCTFGISMGDTRYSVASHNDVVAGSFCGIEWGELSAQSNNLDVGNLVDGSQITHPNGGGYNMSNNVWANADVALQVVGSKVVNGNVVLRNMNGVTFRDMYIRSAASPFSLNYADDITIEGCTLEILSDISYGVYVGLEAGASRHGLSVRNCEFKRPTVAGAVYAYVQFVTVGNAAANFSRLELSNLRAKEGIFAGSGYVNYGPVTVTDTRFTGNLPDANQQPTAQTGFPNATLAPQSVLTVTDQLNLPVNAGGPGSLNLFHRGPGNGGGGFPFTGGDRTNYAVGLKLWRSLGIRNEFDVAKAIYDPVRGSWDVDNGYYVNAIQVVGAQQGVIADDASGAANQATVNAILTALRNHGLIAT